MNRKITIALLFSAIAAGFFVTGCSSLDSLSVGVSRQRPPAAAKSKPTATATVTYRTVGSFRNNREVRLQSGTYRGGFTINAEKVVLTGRGTQQTFIDGDIRIDGNNVTLRNLRVRGNVYVYGNNSRMENSVIEGRVISYANETSRDASRDDRSRDDRSR